MKEYTTQVYFYAPSAESRWFLEELREDGFMFCTWRVHWLHDQRWTIGFVSKKGPREQAAAHSNWEWA